MPTTVLINAPRGVAKAKNAVVKAGHQSFKNFVSVFTFFSFFLSPNHSVSFTNNLPAATPSKNLNILSKIL